MRMLAVVLLALSGAVFGATDAGLVGYWRFDEGNGTTVADATANGLNGTLEAGAAWVTDGVSGSALMFDGKTSFVNIPANPKTDLDALTMSVWVNARKMGGVMCFSSGSNWADQRAVIHFCKSKGGPRFTVSNGSKFRTCASVQVMPLNQWVHLAVTYSDGLMHIYQNGVQVAGPRKADFRLNTNVVPLKIGRTEGLRPNFFDGKIDEVRLYNRALSADEIQQLAKQFAK